MKAIVAVRYGGPETLVLRDAPDPMPGAGEVRVRVRVAGVNYIDIYHRTGLYPTREPVPLGLEGAGVIEALGPGVEGFAEGDRVAWCDVPGSYASHVIARAERLVRVPEGLPWNSAAALMLQGMTAHYLTHDTYAVKPGDACLVHAAAGGVGLLLCQMIKMKGGRVIGTVSSEPKAVLARAAGAAEVIDYTSESTASRVSAFTAGRGARVAYDSVGKDTWEESLKSLGPRGMLVLFGQSSGTVPAFDPGLLARGGSLFLTRPSLFHYIADRQELERRAADVFGWAAAGKLQVRIDAELPLTAAAEAHRRLEGRATSGKLLLIP